MLGFSADAGVHTKAVESTQAMQTVRIRLSPLVRRDGYLKQQSPESRREIESAARWSVRGTNSDVGPDEQA